MGTVAPQVLQLVIASNPLAVRQGLKIMMRSEVMAVMTAERRAMAELVMAEVLNNIVEHAYAAYTGTIDLRLTAIPEGLACRVVDRGLAFPDGALPPGEPPVLAGDLPEGGFGWNLIRTLTTGLHYGRQDGQNHLSFTLPM